MTDDELRALFDPWWERRNSGERAALVSNRHAEFDRYYWEMVMDAEPLERGKPPVIAVTADNKTGRFMLPSILVDYLDLKAAE